MTDNNQESGTHCESAESGPLDRVFDAALAKYAAVEPRIGFEDRILANLRSKNAAPPQTLWRWSWATAAAAIVIIAGLLAWRSSRPSHPVIANHPAVENNSGNPVHKVASAPTKPEPSPSHRSGPQSSTRPPLATSTAYPKLDVFPSPQPLSEAELALAQYVRSFPSDAKKVAQAQAESEKEILARMQALANQSGQSN